MKAVVKTKPEVGIEILDVPMPKIKPNEVLVEIKACGICGTDMPVYEWEPEGRSRRGRPIELPRIIGHEPSGVVAEVGSNVPASWGLKPGNRVAANSWGGCGQCYYCRIGSFNMCAGDRWNIGSLADGAMAEYCAIPFFSLYKVADSVSFEEAALLEPLGIAMHGMEKLVRFKPGDDVAVLGCGPIGLFEALLARVGGANKVFITGLAIDKKRLELARDLGFITINAEEHPVRDVIMDMTGGWGVDVVFDATSGGIFGEALTLLKAVGQLVCTAFQQGPVTFDGKRFMSHEVIITNNLGHTPSAWYRAINLVSSGLIDVKPLLTHKFKIEDADEAFKTVQRREGMKVLIVP